MEERAGILFPGIVENAEGGVKKMGGMKGLSEVEL